MFARRALLALATSALTASAVAQPLEYTIVDMGVVNAGDFGSQAMRVSPNGLATGRSIGAINQAFSWSQGGGQVALPNLATRPFAVGNGINNAGVVVGTGSTTFFGSDPLPLRWENGVVSTLPLPAGETFGRANDINANNVAVGSVNGGSLERAAIYANGGAQVITQTGPGGTIMTTAFSVNDAGRAVGTGIDPNNAARNVGFVYDSATNTAFEVGALPGRNGALAFDVSEAGHVVGSSMQNQGSGTPFIWTDAGGISEIPLPVGTSQGSARGVNSAGWVVGTASSAFAIPFLYDGTQTYRLADLIPDGTDWDFSTNTSSSAMSISEDGIIVGTAELNGQPRAYALIPIPEPGSLALLLVGVVAVSRRR